MGLKMVELDFVENKDLRNEMVGKTEVLEKVKGIITLPNTELLTTRMVADYFEIDFKAISKVTERHRDELSFNGMEFKKYSEIKNLVNCDNLSELKISRQGSNIFSKRAMLNVAMLLRDSKIAREVRTQLLNGYEKLTEEQKVSDINEEELLILEIIRAGSDTMKVAIAINNLNNYHNRHKEQLNKRIDKMKNKEDAFDTFIDASNYQNMNQVAKVLGIGRNTLFEFLREKEILMKDNTPYQKYINQGYFAVKEYSINNHGYVKNNTQTFVTAKGVDYISKLMSKNNKNLKGGS